VFQTPFLSIACVGHVSVNSFARDSRPNFPEAIGAGLAPKPVIITRDIVAQDPDLTMRWFVRALAGLAIAATYTKSAAVLDAQVLAAKIFPPLTACGSISC
jgi:hypothetical protein